MLARRGGGSGVTRTATACSGSSVSSYSWNPDDQLIGFSKPGLSESYQYDPLGRRIAKTSNGTTTYYRYNGDDIDAEYSASWTETARWVHGPNTDDPLMRLTGNTADPTASAIYYHQDGIGSVVATSDQAGNIVAAQLFDAWGNKVQSSGTIQTYGYTGREPDQSGLIYYRARYYDPTIGRFISRDPAGMPDGVNRYAYVNNNPVNFTDPDGKLSFPLHFFITLYAARDAGYGFIDAHRLAWNTMAVDFRGSQGVTPAQTRQHMMAGTSVINGREIQQTKQSAISSGLKFIASQVTAATGSTNFISAGNAAHGIQDKYSPSHQGSLWEGFGKLGVMGTIMHIFEDTFPGTANIKGAYQETGAMLEAVRTGTPKTYLNSNYNAAATTGQQNMNRMANPTLAPAYSGGGSVKRSK